MDSKQLGQNITHLRGKMKQGELAQKMADRGHKWAQRTVSMIETGDRTLKLFEAVDLAAILGVTVDELLNNDDTALTAARERAQVAAAQTKLQAAFYSAVEGQQELLAARRDLREILEHIKTEGTGDFGAQLELMVGANDFSFWSALVEATVRAGETGVLPGVSRKDLETARGRKKLRETINEHMGVELIERPLN